jgi:O-antigen chain-terminating methyltransferase
MLRNRSTGSAPLPKIAVADLLRANDDEFVRGAYRSLLGRAPADSELSVWRGVLMRGATKTEVVAAIRMSAEGRARGVEVEGISGTWQRRLLDVPILGYAMRWCMHLAMLPDLARRLDAAQGTIARHDERVRDLSSAIDDEHEGRAAVEAAVSARLDALVGELRRLESAKAERSQVDALDARASALADWLARIDGALRATNLLTPADEGPERNARFDDYYRRFENRFRGAPEVIRERLMFYVPILREAAAAAEPGRAAPVADLGCGRGEMVRLLCESGLTAYGVDNSAGSVLHCRAENLHALQADAIEHLRSLATDTLGGVTSIHVIEHLPFPALMMLFREAFRALRPGGVAIFETPNPENLIVGACNFYYDPSHIRPLPPEPLRFLLEEIRFAPVSIERLHAGATAEDVDRAVDPVTRLYSTIMLVPQDYALIAYKPHTAATE